MCDDAQERKGKKKESRFEDVSQSHHVRDILHNICLNKYVEVDNRFNKLIIKTSK